MKRFILLFNYIPIILLVNLSAFADIENTKHNLSASGPGTIKAGSESEICIFCHAPHTTTGVSPLWNRTLPNLVYTPYSSSTMQSTPGQPTYDSKLCLSCHDGTIALGSVNSRDTGIGMTGALSGRANLTTDLSDDHPISFVFDAALAAQDSELIDPAFLTGTVRLDPNGQMQCTTCHDAHSETYPMFLVEDTLGSALCISCHQRDGWSSASHGLSTATWNGSGTDPWPYTTHTNVADNACQSCHTPHGAGLPETLLTHSPEEKNCLKCHNENVANTDIETELNKSYRHAVNSTLGVHDPMENALTMNRHVECQDCHNPHEANNSTALAPDVSGALKGVSGVTITGNAIDKVNYQYEVCFKCHGDNSNVPAPNITRQIYQPNIRKKFDPANPSYHPVVAPGKNNDVPSLRGGLTETSIIYCTDCHTNNNGPGNGGSGPAGPHGSTRQYLLERRYSTRDGRREESSLYAMCYKCHSRNDILDDSSFKQHEEHLDGEDVACSACHDPHGISADQGNAINNAHLINFDTDIVSPWNGQLRYEKTGVGTGRCYLTCHGESHTPKNYQN